MSARALGYVMLLLGGRCKLGPLYFGGLGSMGGVGVCGEVACEGYLGGVCVPLGYVDG